MKEVKCPETMEGLETVESHSHLWSGGAKVLMLPRFGLTRLSLEPWERPSHYPGCCVRQREGSTLVFLSLSKCSAVPPTCQIHLTTYRHEAWEPYPSGVSLLQPKEEEGRVRNGSVSKWAKGQNKNIHYIQCHYLLSCFFDSNHEARESKDYGLSGLSSIPFFLEKSLILKKHSIKTS